MPNTQLVTEGTAAALRYKNISVAEQNSVDVAWSILMEPQFEQLRATIYTNESELVRFRQLVVNVSHDLICICSLFWTSSQKLRVSQVAFFVCFVYPSIQRFENFSR